MVAANVDLSMLVAIAICLEDRYMQKEIAGAMNRFGE